MLTTDQSPTQPINPKSPEKFQKWSSISPEFSPSNMQINVNQNLKLQGLHFGHHKIFFWVYNILCICTFINIPQHQQLLLLLQDLLNLVSNSISLSCNKSLDVDNYLQQKWRENFQVSSCTASHPSFSLCPQDHVPEILTVWLLPRQMMKKHLPHSVEM